MSVINGESCGPTSSPVSAVQDSRIFVRLGEVHAVIWPTCICGKQKQMGQELYSEVSIWCNGTITASNWSEKKREGMQSVGIPGEAYDERHSKRGD